MEPLFTPSRPSNRLKTILWQVAADDTSVLVRFRCPAHMEIFPAGILAQIWTPRLERTIWSVNTQDSLCSHWRSLRSIPNTLLLTLHFKMGSPAARTDRSRAGTRLYHSAWWHVMEKTWKSPISFWWGGRVCAAERQANIDLQKNKGEGNACHTRSRCGNQGFHLNAQVTESQCERLQENRLHTKCQEGGEWISISSPLKTLSIPIWVGCPFRLRTNWNTNERYDWYPFQNVAQIWLKQIPCGSGCSHCHLAIRWHQKQSDLGHTQGNTGW